MPDTVANDNTANKKKVVVGPCIISYPQLFVPKQVLGQGEMFFGASFLFDPNTQAKLIQRLVDAATAAANEGWPNGEWKAKRALRDATAFWWPIRNGDEKSERKGYPGKVFVSARTKNRPGVVDQNVQPVLNAEQIYPGMLVNVSLAFFAFKMPRWGIGCGLNNVQIVGDGERLGGRPDPSDEFQPVSYSNDNGEPDPKSWLA